MRKRYLPYLSQKENSPILKDLHAHKRFKRKRESSYDQSGANGDFLQIDTGEVHRIPPLAGPGIIRHIWMTMDGDSSDFYRELQFVLRFDNAPTPQIDLPLADFFLFGHGLLVDVNAGAEREPEK